MNGLFLSKPVWALAQLSNARAVCYVAALAKGIDHSLRTAPCIPSRKTERAAMWGLIRGSI